jgi:hypothetical protein
MCDRCARIVPEAVLIEQDGNDHCPLCYDKTSRSELDQLVAEQTSEVDSFEPAESPAGSSFTGAVTFTAISPTLPVTLVNDGAAVAITFTGVGFTSSIDIEYNDAGITDDSGPTISTTSIALSLVASGVTPGYYTLEIGGARFFNALKVTD